MYGQLHYSMVIQWSDEDQAYIVSFPEWELHGLIGHPHGATYEEAVKNGQEVLDMLVEGTTAANGSLPAAQTFTDLDRVS